MSHKAAIWIYLGTFGWLVAAGLGFPTPEELPIVLAGAAVGHADEDPAPTTIQVPVEMLAAFSATPLAPLPANLPWTLLISNQLVVRSNEIQVPSSNQPRVSPLPHLHVWIMLPLCILGAISGDVFLYGVGRFGGPRLLDNRWVLHLLKPDKRAKIEQNFHKYGVLVLVFARFLPTIRSPIFIMAGIMRIRFVRFLVADGLAGCVGVSFLFTLAYWFGDQFRDLVERAEGRVHKLQPLLILLAITAFGSYLIYHFLRHPVATGDPGEEVPLLGEKVAAKIEKPRLPGFTPAPTIEQPAAGNVNPGDRA